MIENQIIKFFPSMLKTEMNLQNLCGVKGIQVNINNRRNDIYDMFGGIQTDLKNLERADNDVILIPMHNDLKDDDVDRIIDNIKLYDKIDLK